MMLNNSQIDTWAEPNTHFLNTKYIILSNFLQINELDIKNKLGKRKDMVPILQNVGLGSQENDYKRLQLINMNEMTKTELKVDVAEMKISQLFEEASNVCDKKRTEHARRSKAQVTLKGKKKQRKVYNVVTSVLKSVQGCREQHFHTDYSYHHGKSCFISLLAIEDNTTLQIVKYDQETHPHNTYIKETVHIPKGSLFIARGDFVHSGSSYVKANYRYHFYIDNLKYAAFEETNIDRDTHYLLNFSLNKLPSLRSIAVKEGIKKAKEKRIDNIMKKRKNLGKKFKLDRKAIKSSISRNAKMKRRLMFC
eukprot:gene14425-19356_t